MLQAGCSPAKSACPASLSLRWSSPTCTMYVSRFWGCWGARKRRKRKQRWWESICRYYPKIHDYRSTGHVICFLSPPPLSLSFSLLPLPLSLSPAAWALVILLPSPRAVQAGHVGQPGSEVGVSSMVSKRERERLSKRDKDKASEKDVG